MATYVRDNNGWFDGSIGDGRKAPVTIAPVARTAADDTAQTESLVSVFETFEDVRKWKAARLDGLKARSLQHELAAVAAQVHAAEEASDSASIDLFRGRLDALSVQAKEIFARVGVDGTDGPAAREADRIEQAIMPVYQDVARRLGSGTPAAELSDSERLIYNSVISFQAEAERVSQVYPVSAASPAA